MRVGQWLAIVAVMMSCRAVTAADASRTPAQLYRVACAACHGPQGAGAPQELRGFEAPETFPDFSDCTQASPEQDVSWRAIIRDGGPARGFSEIMPAFGDALSDEEQRVLVRHLRSFCTDARWPRGELNVPRGLVTEKAFPESEWILGAGMALQRGHATEGELAYERRLGARGQLEVAAPFASLPDEAGGTTRGIGDAVVGFKQVIGARYDDATRRGSIFALQAEVSLPTGSERRGLGAGTPVFSLFGAYDVLLPPRGFLQFQGGIDVPHDTGKAARSAFLRSAFGFSLSSGEGFGRTWSPMIEVAGERPLDGSEAAQWDLVPGLQVTLNTRQHVRAAVGYQMPLTSTQGRPSQLLFYVLWDWADGGLKEGW